MDDIIIENGGDLRIFNRTLYFKPGAGIIVKEGGQLLVSNSTLDLCPQALETLKWSGIFAPNSDSDITIAMTQGTTIKNADTGLLLGAQFRDGNGLNTPTVALSEVSFIDNNVGVHSFSNDLGQFNFCHFINNQTGISLIDAGEDVEHLKIFSCEFIDNDIGVLAINSSINVSSGNTFSGEEGIGIVTGMTSPLFSNTIIGNPFDNGVGGNTFSNLEQGVIVMGAGGPLGLSIVNNTFNNVQLNATISGESSFSVANNLFENSRTGLFVIGSGSMINRIQCDSFLNTEHGDILLYGANTNTQFLENVYYSPNASFKNIAYNAILPDMGSTALSASNCFNDNAGLNPDIRSINSNDFTYFYRNTNECQAQEPNELSSVLKEEANDNFNGCNGLIGPFNYIEPCYGNGEQIDINDFDVNLVYRPCIIDNIGYYKNQIIAHGGDNPYTGSASVSVPTTELVKKEQIFEQWVNFGLFVASQKKDYDFAEEILAPLNDWNWKIRHYGVSLERKDFSEATNRLAALPNTNTNQTAFKSTQEINLKYLRAKALGTENQITQEDIEVLREIGRSIEPSSGYARTLLLLLTGEMLPTSIPDLEEFIGETKAQEEDEGSNLTIPTNDSITIFPNPAKDFIQIKSESDPITRMILTDIYGKRVILKEGNYHSARIEIAGINSGIYLVRLQLENGELITQKIIIDN